MKSFLIGLCCPLLLLACSKKESGGGQAGGGGQPGGTNPVDTTPDLRVLRFHIQHANPPARGNGINGVAVATISQQKITGNMLTRETKHSPKEPRQE